MGLVDEFRGSIVCIDTAPFIYFIEKNSKYLGLCDRFLLKSMLGKLMR